MFINFSDNSFIQIQEKFNKGVVTLTDSQLKIVQVDSTNLWCNRYGEDTSLARFGLEAMRRYSQNGKESFKNLGLRIADQYIETTPGCNKYPMWPTALSAAIDLQMYAYRFTHLKKYRRQALIFGRLAKALFIDDVSPLPKAFSENFNHYEAISGGADLMFSFYKLAGL